jgi:hypothetical protein
MMKPKKKLTQQHMSCELFVKPGLILTSYLVEIQCINLFISLNIIFFKSDEPEPDVDRWNSDEDGDFDSIRVRPQNWKDFRTMDMLSAAEKKLKEIELQQELGNNAEDTEPVFGKIMQIPRLLMLYLK